MKKRTRTDKTIELISTDWMSKDVLEESIVHMEEEKGGIASFRLRRYKTITDEMIVKMSDSCATDICFSCPKMGGGNMLVEFGKAMPISRIRASEQFKLEPNRSEPIQDLERLVSPVDMEYYLKVISHVTKCLPYVRGPTFRMEPKEGMVMTVYMNELWSREVLETLKGYATTLSLLFYVQGSELTVHYTISKRG